MKPKGRLIIVNLFSVLLLVGVLLLAVIGSPFSTEASNSFISIGMGSQIELGSEVEELRTDSTQTFYKGNNQYETVIYSWPIFYKDDYSNQEETWKPIDLTTWDGTHLDTAPYILDYNGTAITFRDKETNRVSVLTPKTLNIMGITPQIIPLVCGVAWRFTVPVALIPTSVQLKVASIYTGECTLINQARDNLGSLRLLTTLEDGNLIEELSIIKSGEQVLGIDFFTGELRPLSGNITIDPVVTIQPSAKDTFIMMDVPTANYGTAESILVRRYSGLVRRSLIEFDITDIPAGVSIADGNLSLYYYNWTISNPSGTIIWAYNLTRTNWVETEACWSYYKDTTTWTTGGGDYETAGGTNTTCPAANQTWMHWNVTTVLGSAYSNSNPLELLLRYSTEGSGTDVIPIWWTKEYVTDTSLCPKLNVTYTYATTAKYPRTNTTVAETGDDNDWTSITNIGADDATYASITANTFDNPDTSYLIRATNFNTGVPSGATIDGIVVEIERYSTSAAEEASDYDVCLTKDGTTRVGSDYSTGDVYATTPEKITFGGATDKWGTTWSQANVTASTFGVLYKAYATDANAEAFVDYIRVTIYYTPSEAPSITVSPTGYAFGTVTESSTYNTTTSYFTLTNDSTMETDQTISVTTSTWSGGLGWTHSDTCTPGSATAGLKSNRGGTWGTGDVIVKNASPNYIYENCPASTGYSFGLSLHTPTAFTDGVLKEITVRITATVS